MPSDNIRRWVIDEVDDYFVNVSDNYVFTFLINLFKDEENIIVPSDDTSVTVKWSTSDNEFISAVIIDTNASPLVAAAANGNYECVKLLVENRVDSHHANSALLIASEAQGSIPVEYRKKEKGFVKILDILLKHGASIYAKCSRNSSILIHAAKYGNSECLDKIFSTSADIEDIIDNDGENALLVAACGGHENCVKKLLERFKKKHENKFEAYLESKDEKGNTAWILASKNINGGNATGNVLRTLADKEYKVNHLAKNNVGHDAFYYAFNVGNQESIAVIIDITNSFERTKVENKLKSSPIEMFLDHSCLRRCISPMKTIKATLYNEEKLDVEYMHIKTILRNILKHPKVLQYLLTYNLSLVLAAQYNVLEEDELKLKIEDIQKVINEIFKSSCLETLKTLVHLLLPKFRDSEDSTGYDSTMRKKWMLRAAAHSIKTNAGVINYCVTHELKEIFQFSQVSSIVNNVFYATLAPQLDTQNNVVFLIAQFTNLNPIDLYNFRRYKIFAENMRYNPCFTFVSDLIRYQFIHLTTHNNMKLIS